MRKLIDLLLGIDRDAWEHDTQAQIEWIGVPSGDAALVVLAGVVLAAWGVLYLYRREGRGLGLRVRLLLTGLRLAALLAVLAMLLEPVLVLKITELARSHLLVLVDTSTGTRSIVSDFGDATQGPLGNKPFDVIAKGVNYAVIDFGAGTSGRGALFAVNGATGARVLISDFGKVTQGPLGQEPAGLFLSP